MISHSIVISVLLLFTGIAFGVTFVSPFNDIDILNVDWGLLGENPLVFSVMLSIMGFYLCCLIWARRWDMKDEVKVSI